MRIFSLDRKTPCRLFDDFSELENAVQIKDRLCLTAQKGEYFIVQLLLVSDEDKEEIRVSTSEALTCFNTQGNSKFGEHFEHSITVTDKEIQPLYFGIDTENREDIINTEIVIYGKETHKISLTVTQHGDNVVNHGYNDLWRMSRLNWLNSDLERNDSCTSPFIPVTGDANQVSVLGRKIVFGSDCQIQNAYSYFDESVLLCDSVQKQLLSKPFVFDTGENVAYGKPVFTRQGDNAEITNKGESESLLIDVKCGIKYEGMLEYTVMLEAKADCELQNVSLSCVFEECSSLYSNGLGKKGGKFSDLTHKWNHWHQDCMYIGSVNCGARVKWKAASYRRPLTNIYYQNREMLIPQDTWANNDNGQIVCIKTAEGGLLKAETGKYLLKKGEIRKFKYQIHITPFTPVDYKKHYETRYYHGGYSGKTPEEIVSDAKKGKCNYIIVHHGSEYHPYINYPFIANDYLKALVGEAHKNNIGVKVYYTLREHGTRMAELFAYKSFGNEIIYYKKNGVFCHWPEGENPWLRKYLGESCIPAWRVLYKTGPFAGEHDISFLVNPDTRLDNYYVEGLKWLIDEIGIDGIYVDDTALDRTTFERARKVIDGKSGLKGLIDMHTCNHENDSMGNVSCINMYTELAPFVDDFWIGELFWYDKMAPDEIMCEASALPYGKAGSMLQDDGNLWIGMMYAMSSRNRGRKNIVSDGIYQVWDSFGIADSVMLGYWHSKNPFKTTDDDVLVTSYKKDGEALVCICNFAEEEKEIFLICDQRLLGFTISTAEKMHIDEFQEGGAFDMNCKHKIKAKQGIIVRAKE